MNNYDAEAKTRFGDTAAYSEFEKKTAHYSGDKWQETNDGLMNIFSRFAERKKCGHDVGSEKAWALVKELQEYITDNYYTCDEKILSGLGQMYVADERFKANIDKYGNGTAEFVSKAIEIYCR